MKNPKNFLRSFRKRFERKDTKERMEKARIENAAQDSKRISELELQVEILIKKLGES